MAKRSHPHTAACRCSDRELARLDAAARLKGAAHRAEYIRQVLMERVELDLRAAVAAER